MIAPGTRIGPYEISGALGAGGMGEVYRARDTKLGREVAIKILPERWLLDPERRARFDREARVLASLNHPNVGAIYGVEEGDGVRALVLELIAGPTLADWLKDGPLPARDALRIAVQIASALDAAHERGIVHRDLKPANVILRGARRSTAARPPSGPRKPDSGPGGELTVKVVDFGLAKEFETAAAGADLADLPTRTQEATREGVLIGTVAYMSPEQARGERVDQRTDLWAFGCVLYEMLTGRAPFSGASLPDTLAAIVTKDPDWRALPGDTAAEVRRLLRRCLEKDWHQRLRDAGDVRIALEDAAEGHDEGSPIARPMLAPPKPNRNAVLFVLAAVIIGLAVGWLVSRGFSGRDRAETSSAGEMRLEISTPPTEDPVSLAISPDGKHLAFVASSEGRSMLWVRSLESGTARPLPGSEGASLPFWSPDGSAIGFFANRRLLSIDLELDGIQVLAAAAGGRGGTWGPDGFIVYQPSPIIEPLFRVPASGGAAVPIESLLGRFPHFLPGGRHLLFSIPEETGLGVYVAAADGSGARHLLAADGAAVYASGHLLFVRGTTLLAHRFDPIALTLSGAPFPIATGVNVASPLRCAPLSAAPAGPIVFRAGVVGGLRQFAWIDRAGREVAKLGDPIGQSLNPSLSPDGSLVAFYQNVGGTIRVWLLETGRGITRRLSSGSDNEFAPVWSPDGTDVAFSSDGDLMVRSLDGGEPRVLRHREAPTEGLLVPSDWSRDGRFLLYQNGGGRSAKGGLWVLPLDRPEEPIAFEQTDFLEKDGQFSPDGQWIAYTSEESGEPEVYVKRFPGSLAKQLVSTSGGGMAAWRPDGRELFYISLEGKLIAVPVETGGDGSLRLRAPVSLFDAHAGPPLQDNSGRQYMVAPDGQRFLVNTIAEQQAPPVTIIVNWQP